jgi:hypothetical protein
MQLVDLATVIAGAATAVSSAGIAQAFVQYRKSRREVDRLEVEYRGARANYDQVLEAWLLARSLGRGSKAGQERPRDVPEVEGDTRPAPGDESAAASEPPPPAPTPPVVPPARSSFWGPALLALLGSAGVLGAAAISRSEPPPPDCVVYSQELVRLEAAYSPQQLERALAHLEFDRYEKACGDAASILRELANP